MSSKTNSERTRLQDKTILITGGSSGMGLETARVALRRGARVVITNKNITEKE